MGLSSSKKKTSQTSTGTATTTPQLPSWLEGPTSQYYGQVGNLLSQHGSTGLPERGPSQLQQQAFGQAGGLSSFNQSLSDAMGSTRGLLNFEPGSVEAGQLSQTDLSPYMNPYTQNVIDTSLNDLNRFRQGAISNNQGAATMSGAYGGSRHGVADAETNRGFLDQASSLVANLRNTGFQNAQQGAQFDISNRLNADQFNVNSGITGAGVRMGAANQLGQLGLSNDANARANIGTQADLGAQQRGIDAENDPVMRQMQFLAQLRSLLGINGSDVIGQQVDSSGTSNTTETSSPSLINTIGSIVQTIGGLQKISDRRLKRDIVPLDADINGTPLYEFSYLWDEPGVRHVGVMAQEAPPHAVITLAGNWLAVDYGKLL